jgi:hypothetical protein
MLKHRHSYAIEGLRALPKVIRRGQQKANVEMTRVCGICGKEKRVGLLWIEPQARATGQSAK